MILFPFFSSFLGAQSSTKHGGERVLRFFFSANAGGNALRATYLRQTWGGKGFFCPFFGGVFGSSVPFLFFFWRGGVPNEAAEATRAEELGSEEAEEQG